MASSTKLRLKVEYVPIGRIKAYNRNPRRHGQSQIALIAASMAEHGNVNPLLVDHDLVIIAGHGRLEASKIAGFAKVPVIRLGHLSEAKARLYRLADNRLAELSTWSIDDLNAEFAQIELEMPSLDLQLSGWTMDAIDGFRDQAEAGPVDADDPSIPGLDRSEPVTQHGDVWQLRDHRLICGDATDAETYRNLLDHERPAMIFADPPYNVPIAGHVSGLGKSHHREFVQASGEMSDAEFQQFLLAFMRHCSRFGRPGALHYVCMDWRHLRPLLLAGSAAYDELISLCVWAKTNAGMGSLYRSAHELIAVFKHGKAPHRNNVKLPSG